MAKKLPAPILDELARAGWKAYDNATWAKDGFLLEIQKLRNGNFAVEIKKMSAANTKLVSHDELSRLIANPQIIHY